MPIYPLMLTLTLMLTIMVLTHSLTLTHLREDDGDEFLHSQQAVAIFVQFVKHFSRLQVCDVSMHLGKETNPYTSKEDTVDSRHRLV